MKAATRIALSVALASSLALGEAMAPADGGAAAEPAAPSAAPAAFVPPAPSAPDRVVDLDFTDDFPAPNRVNRIRRGMRTAGKVTRPLPPAVPVAAPARSRSWMYWTMGLSAMAAGGAAWYLHWDAQAAPAPVRKDQVFTDDPD